VAKANHPGVNVSNVPLVGMNNKRKMGESIMIDFTKGNQYPLTSLDESRLTGTGSDRVQKRLKFRYYGLGSSLLSKNAGKPL
jgi:hypothetical protein